MTILVPRLVLEETFGVMRECGAAQRECQVLWLSAWRLPDRITEARHSEHTGHAFGFGLDSQFINNLWRELEGRGLGVRVQVHTHPEDAFHSRTDDMWPLVHTAGFLSLVIPDFARGPVGFDNAYLACIEADGSWRERRASDVFGVEGKA